ncbi:HSF-type DNA-binding protein [Nitzschia inconspicua]|uniref:HSF-type DNA-binding protein n=1 Tax=Nitzschia inconspicua TaxID=303405 RepID=A0A9K3PHG7_9STRA|nr:HSF-type DNA-binding protein [Nitzschia inconspicua]
MMNFINDRLNKERSNSSSNLSVSSSGSGTAVPSFAITLHTLLTDAEALGFDDVICWLPGGQAFKVLDSHRFATEIMPRYFNQTKYKSFQRQCNIYGFQRVHHGPHKGGYTHKMFIQGIPDLCTEIKRETSPVSQQIPSVHNQTHRRGASLDFRAMGPAMDPVAFAPPRNHQRHRRVVSWDARAEAEKIKQEPLFLGISKQEPFDWGMIAGAALSDLNPSSPLRDDVRLLSEPVGFIQEHPFAPLCGSDFHPSRQVAPLASTLPSRQELESPSMASHANSTSRPLASKMEDPLHNTKAQQDDLSFFKDLFSPTDLEVEKELLDTFDVGNEDAPPMMIDFSAPGSDFLACESSSSVVDELMDLAGNVSVGVDAPLSIGTLPPVPEPDPLSLPMPESYQEPRPMSAMVSPLASGAVNEHNFPRKLYRLLEDCESNPTYRSIVSWSEDGTSFSVNCKKKFVEYILPNYFDQTQYASFRRQLNMYNFVRQGNTSTYSNPHFIKNRRDLLDLIQRKSVNQSKGN